MEKTAVKKGKKVNQARGLAKDLKRVEKVAREDQKRSEKMTRIDESKLRQRITFPGFGY